MATSKSAASTRTPAFPSRVIDIPEQTNTDETRRSILHLLMAGALLALMVVLAGGAALRESATIDEVSHIGAGVSYLQKLDLRMNPEHPPLPKMLAALPLIGRRIHADYNDKSWKVSDKFFQAFLGQWAFGESLLERWNDPKSTLAWARMPMLLLMLSLGCVIYVYSQRLGGKWAGGLCLALYVSTPTFLTFGPLVHTDIAVTLFSLLTLWTFASLWQWPTRRNTVIFALSFAGALLSKFSAPILLVVFLAFAIGLRWRSIPGQPDDKEELREWRRIRRRATFLGILYAGMVVYFFYLIFSLHQPTDALHRIGHNPFALIVRRLLFPFFLYLRGIFFVVVTSRRPTFLLGHTYPHGVWFYFPVLFALKSSLAFLLLLAFTALAAIARRVGGKTGSALIASPLGAHWRAFWVGFLVFTAVCLVSPMQISIRHFSIPIALLIVMIASLPGMLRHFNQRFPILGTMGAAVVVVLVANCLFIAVRQYPNYFAYMNSLGFGRPAYMLATDSNLDWNQSLPEVRRFAESHNLLRIGIDEYGFSDATASVPQAQTWNCQNPGSDFAGAWVALSANLILDASNCAWLMQYPHEMLAGGSMYAVHLPATIPPAGSLGGPPLPSAYRGFVGAPFDIRGLFEHTYHHSEDIPRAIDWLQSTFTALSKSPGPPPKMPWEQ